MSGGISGIGVIRGRGYSDRWHKAVKTSASGGIITDKAV